MPSSAVRERRPATRAARRALWGATAATLLTHLFSDPTPDETEAQRDAKANVVSSLVAGIAGMADPSAAATVTVAATANVGNNWLATQQEIQYQKEMAAAPNAAEKLKTFVKWQGVISTKQDLLTADGLGKGLSEGLAGIGLSTLDSFSEAMKHPMDTYAALTDLYKTTSFQQALGAASGEFKANLDRLGEDLEIGGDDKAEDLGYRFGKALATAVALIAAPQSDAAMGAKALADLGVTVSSKAYTALRAKVVVEALGIFRLLAVSTVRIVTDTGGK